jgi:DeoR/GlpR family transcriptional regulator of sugar metabolism
MMTATERFTYTSAPERRDRIVQFVTERGYCTITELSQLFDVSEMTIRRDVSRLVSDDKLRGFHGGVGSLAPQVTLGRDYSQRDLSMAEEKRAIALEASELAERESVIAIDSGTTASRIASFLPGKKLRVITNSLPVVSSLAGLPGVEVICLGGVLYPESLSFAGPATLSTISYLHVDTLFLSANGLNERGAFCSTGLDAITKRALIEVAERVVLVADSSKFSTSAMVKACGWDAIDAMVTDSGITEEQRSMLAQNDVQVITVDLATSARQLVHASAPV